jgi:mannosyltransferase
VKKHSNVGGRNIQWLVLVLCLLSFGRGVYGLGDQSLWWDESLSHYRAARPFTFILSNQIFVKSGDAEADTTDNHPPLYFILLRLAVLTAGNSEFSLRFLSAASGVLLVPLLYLCGRRLFDPPSGMLASLLGALSPLYLWYQQEARPYALVTLLGLVSFYALIRALQDPGSSRRARVLRSVLYILSVAAMLTTHYLSFFLLAAEGIILIFSWSRNRRYLSWFMAVTGALAAILFAWGLKAMPTQPQLPGYPFLPLPTLLGDVFRAFTVGLSGDQLVLCRWAGIGLFALGAGILFARHRHVPWPHTAYLLLCFFLPVGEMFVLSLVRPAYLGARHLIFASPFYYLLLAAGVSQAGHIRARVVARAVMGIGLGVVLTGMLVSTYAYRTDPAYDKEDHRGWGEYLSEHIRPGDAVIVNSGFISELYSYYVKSQAPQYGLPIVHGVPEVTYRQLEEIVTRYDRVWVAHSSTPGWANAGNLTLKWLEKHTTRIAFAHFDSPSTVVQAHAFRLKPPFLDAMPGVPLALALNFDDQLHLLGLDAPVDGAMAGHTVPLSLYWSPAQALDRAYRVTLSLNDDAGFSWAAMDYAPCNGAYATARWPAGRIVRDDADLKIPPGTPPGRYRLNVSVYPADEGASALPVRDLEDDSLQGLIVPVAEIPVVRPAMPPPDQELDIPQRTFHRYRDMALLGHDYRGGTYQAGDIVSLSMYWKALGTSRQDAAFSLTLLDGDGKTWGQRDIVPASGYPPSQWTKGEIVRGQYRFRIAIDTPEGEYRLYLGSKGERPPDSLWPWKDERVALGTLAVRPATGDHTFAIPPMQYALRANLDDKVELLGYDLAAETIRPGEVVSCTLYWRALQEINRNYTVFNHLVAADGQTWGQWDNQPQRGGLPTTRWMPGQVIADPYQIPVSADAPAGPLELWTGMYDALTMTRLPVRDENGRVTGDHVILTEVQVRPQ